MQEPDPRPGAYYVSVIDAGRTALLSGPYPTHAAALAAVDKVRELANIVDHRSVFYAFGTVRWKDDAGEPETGLFQRRGLLAAPTDPTKEETKCNPIV